MALIQPPLMVNGAVHSAQIMRMMARNLARASQGVVEGDDLKVTQMTTPGAGVSVLDGASIITGATSRSQGSYTLFNVGAATVPIAPTGASARYDLICLRVEDPEYEGTKNPASEDIGYFQVIPGVTSTTVAPPAGYSAIALARVAIPANTQTITNSMITDLRRVANPRRERVLHTAFPASRTQITTKDGKWHDWPTMARWSIAVPSWAVSAKVIITVAGARFYTNDVYGKMQTVLGTVEGDDTIIDDDEGNRVRRHTIVIADSLTVPAAMRGTMQTLKLQTALSGEGGDVSVDAGTSLIADVEFTEGTF
jgi:hypothetical protein